MKKIIISTISVSVVFFSLLQSAADGASNSAARQPSDCQIAFELIKTAIKELGGSGSTEESALQYAKKWTETHPCKNAEIFSKDLAAIKRMAYSSKGFDFDQRNAADWAKKWINYACEAKVPYERVAEIHHDYAIHSNGLDESSIRAAVFVMYKMKEKYFACDGSVYLN